MNDSWMGAYHINDYYYKMMRTAEDDDIYAYFRNCLHRARFLLNSLEQRRKPCCGSRKPSPIIGRIFPGKRPSAPHDAGGYLQRPEYPHLHRKPRYQRKVPAIPGGTILMRDLFTTAVSGSSPQRRPDRRAGQAAPEHLNRLRRQRTSPQRPEAGHPSLRTRHPYLPPHGRQIPRRTRNP